MKLPCLLVVLSLCTSPLQAAMVHIDTRGNTAHIIVHEGRYFSEGPVYYGGVETQNGYGLVQGRRVIYYYPPYVSPVDRSERFMNNSGTGAHGPGTY